MSTAPKVVRMRTNYNSCLELQLLVSCLPVGSKFWKSGKVIRAFLSSNYEALAAEDDDDFRTTDRSAEHHKRRKLSQTPKASDDMRQSDMLDSMNDELTVLRYRVKAL